MTLLKELIQKVLKAYKRQKAWEAIDEEIKGKKRAAQNDEIVPI